MDIENKYYQVEEDGVPSQSGTSGRCFKAAMMPMALLAMMPLTFMCIVAATSTSGLTFSSQPATNLAGVGLSPLLSSSSAAAAGAFKPGMMHAFNKNGMQARSTHAAPSMHVAPSTQANNLQRMRDVKVRHGADWDDMPADMREDEARRQLGEFNTQAIYDIAALTDEDWARMQAEDLEAERKELASDKVGEGELQQGTIFKILGGFAVMIPLIITILSKIVPESQDVVIGSGF